MEVYEVRESFSEPDGHVLIGGTKRSSD